MTPFLILKMTLSEQSLSDVAISKFGRRSRLSGYFLVARKTLIIFFSLHLSSLSCR